MAAPRDPYKSVKPACETPCKKRLQIRAPPVQMHEEQRAFIQGATRVQLVRPKAPSPLRSEVHYSKGDKGPAPPARAVVPLQAEGAREGEAAVAAQGVKDLPCAGGCF